MAADNPADRAERVDLLMISAMTQQRPEAIKGWVLIAELEDGSQAVTTSGCCVHHAGGMMEAITCPLLAELPPCSSEGG